MFDGRWLMKTCPAMLSHFCSPFSPRIYQKRHENARICFQFDPGFDHRNTGFDSPCYFIIISCYLSSKLSLRIKIERYPIYYLCFLNIFSWLSAWLPPWSCCSQADPCTCRWSGGRWCQYCLLASEMITSWFKFSLKYQHQPLNNIYFLPRPPIFIVDWYEEVAHRVDHCHQTANLDCMIGLK